MTVDDQTFTVTEILSGTNIHSRFHVCVFCVLQKTLQVISM